MVSKLACFFKRKTRDFTRYFQSLDTNSCELIVIDRAGGHIFAQRRPRTLSNGKSAKVLFMANCGIRVAMDIGVSCDHVSCFYRYFLARRLRCLEANVYTKARRHHWSAAP